MRLLHAKVIVCRFNESVLASADLDACGGSYLVCQCQFKHGDNSTGMEIHLWVYELSLIHI